MKKCLIYIILIGIVLFGNSQTTIAQNISDAKIKAIYIFNFTKYVNWRSPEKLNTFKIGVYGGSEVYKELVEYCQDKTFGDRHILYEVIAFKRQKDIYQTPVQALYIDYVYNQEVKDIYTTLTATETLIITDRLATLDHCMINILPLDKGQKRYQINKQNMYDANLSFEKQLLLHGGTEAEIRSLYVNIESELKKEEEKLAEQKLLLEKQKQENLRQKEENLKLAEFIENQKKELEILTLDLGRQQRTLDSNMNVLSSQRENMKIQEDAILKQQYKLHEQNMLAEEQNKSIQKQSEEITKQEKRIEEQRKTLKSTGVELQSQKKINLIMAGFLAMFVVMMFVIWRGYVIKQRVNKQLNLKNIAINQQKEEIEAQSKQLELINTELEKLSIVASKTQNAVTIMDAAGNIEWVNAGFTRLYGYTLQLLTHERDSNIIKISGNPKIKDIVNSCIQNKRTERYETSNMSRNGEMLWVQTTLTPILNDDGEVIKLVAIDADIRELKEANEKIMAQSAELEKLSIVASETSNAVTICDGMGNFVWINHAHEEMYGYSIDELKTKFGTLLSDFTPSHVISLVQGSILKKNSIQFEYKAIRKMGGAFWVQTVINPVMNQNGDIKNLILVQSDISKIKEAEQEIRQQHEEILQQKETLEMQNEEIQAQRDKVETQNRHIRGSIQYALTIQNAILPIKDVIDNYFESFVIFRPKDIVSGDFYWFHHFEDLKKTIVAVVDCTGHGVPGAFMGMIGNRLLNEIIIEKRTLNPADILENLNSGITKALKQDKTDNNDGMDVALCSIDHRDENTYFVTFCGAKRPLHYFLKNEKLLDSLKGVRRSIGGMRKKRVTFPFIVETVTLHSGDVIYLNSDGLIDQNDPERKKYGSPRLLEILERIANNEMKEQKRFLESDLELHMKESEQRDDITFLGLRMR